MAPGVRIEMDETRMSGRNVLPNGRSISWTTDAPAEIACATYYPEFGKSLPTTALAVPLIEGRLTTTFDWS
jgi:hypothetical protein